MRMEVGAMEEGWTEGIMDVENLIIEGGQVGEIDGTITTVTVIIAHVKNPPDVEALIQTATIARRRSRMITRRRTRKKKKASEYPSTQRLSICIH